MSTITIEIPEYLRKQVEALSLAEGFSVDQFFATAASEKLSVIRELDYIAQRASKADDHVFEEVLKSIPASPEIPEWDRIPTQPTENKAAMDKPDPAAS